MSFIFNRYSHTPENLHRNALQTARFVLFCFLAIPLYIEPYLNPMHPDVVYIVKLKKQINDAEVRGYKSLQDLLSF